MFEGRYVRYDEVRYELSASGGGTSSGFFTASWGARFTTAYTPDYVDLVAGIHAYAGTQAGHDGPRTRIGFQIEALGIGQDWSADATLSPSVTVRLIGVTLTCEATATWRLEIARVRVECPLGAFEQAGNWTLRSGMTLTPASVPLVGFPPLVEPNAGVDPFPLYPAGFPRGRPPEAGTTVTASCSASLVVRRIAAGMADSVDSASPSVSVTANGVSGSSDGGKAHAMPTGVCSVARMEPGYAAYVERWGFPLVPTYDSTTDGEMDGPSQDGPDPVTTGTVSSTRGPLPFARAVVGDGLHAIEGPMGQGCPQFVLQDHADYHLSGDTVVGHGTHHEFPQPELVDQSGMAPCLTHDVPIVAAYNAWANPLWSYFMGFPPAGASDAVGWPALGGTQDPEGYWLPIRQQMARSPYLPLAEATQERIDVFTEPLSQNGLAGLMANQVAGFVTSWWGVADFTPLPLSPPGNAQWTRDGTGYWGVEDDAASLTFGPSAVTVSGPCSVHLRLGGWGQAPAMLGRLAKRIVLGWTTPDGWAVSATLEGVNGEELALGSTPGTFDLARKAAKRSTGSYLESFAPDPPDGPGPDVGVPSAPDDAARMAYDAEGALCALSTAAGAWYRVRFDVVAPDDPGTARPTILYPRAPTAWGGVRPVRETGQWASLPIPDGPLVRFSGLFWNPLTDALLDEPLVPSYGCPTAWDALAWRSSVGRGVPALADPVALARESGWVEGREWVSPKHLARDPFQQAQVTTAFVASDSQENPLPCVVNSYRAAPPMALFPRPLRDRAHDWGTTGQSGHRAYSLCKKVRTLLGVAETPPTISPPTGRALLQDDPSTPVAGWAARTVRLASDGLEDDEWTLRAGGKPVARVRPYRGFAFLYGVVQAARWIASLWRGDGRPYRMHPKDGDTVLGAASLSALGSFAANPLGRVATDGFLVPGIGARVVVGLVVDGSLVLLDSPDEGRTLSETMTDGPATAAAAAPNGDGTFWCLRVEGGTVKATLRNVSDRSLVSGPTATNLTGLSDSARLSADRASTQGNAPAILLHVTDGGSVVSYLSTDSCKTFKP